MQITGDPVDVNKISPMCNAEFLYTVVLDIASQHNWHGDCLLFNIEAKAALKGDGALWHYRISVPHQYPKNLKQYVTLAATHCFEKQDLTMHVNTSHKSAVLVKPGHTLWR